MWDVLPIFYNVRVAIIYDHTVFVVVIIHLCTKIYFVPKLLTFTLKSTFVRMFVDFLSAVNGEWFYSTFTK